MLAQNRRLLIFLLSIPLLLLIPLIAMQFSSEVNWSPGDFVIMGLMLLGGVLLIEVLLRKVKKTSQRIIFIGLVVLAFLLLWAELAVGIFGSFMAGT